MALSYPNDVRFTELTSQWMLGEDLLVSPVLTEDNSTVVLLPEGLWYERGFTVGTQALPYMGPTQLTLQNVPLHAVPSFVRAGGIIPCAPPINFTDALPGGPLLVEVYSGRDSGGGGDSKDGSFHVLFEDDGESAAVGSALTRLTLSWVDAESCLYWGRQGNYTGGSSFTQLFMKVFLTNGSVVLVPEGQQPAEVGDGGKLCIA